MNGWLDRLMVEGMLDCIDVYLDGWKDDKMKGWLNS